MGLVARFLWVNNRVLGDFACYDWAQRDNCRRTYVRKRVFRPETYGLAGCNTCSVNSDATCFGNFFSQLFNESLANRTGTGASGCQCGVARCTGDDRCVVLRHAAAGDAKEKSDLHHVMVASVETFEGVIGFVCFCLFL